MLVKSRVHTGMVTAPRLDRTALGRLRLPLRKPPVRPTVPTSGDLAMNAPRNEAALTACRLTVGIRAVASFT
ncbi:hypothetical protein TNCT6_71440 [Streptomyces sp. 6-11-2]|nr:hypothetical protein TNCT6_71440 [Streptomyces sp. 6-11-2]